MRKAIGIIRVSQAKGREGESFISPEDQRRRIEETTDRVDLALVTTHEEVDVSGGKPLTDRAGLLAAIGEIEAGRAEVLIVGYFDRLVRSVAVQGQIVSRVEAAGGEVLAVDYGRITESTAVQWLSGTMLGAVHEYVRRSATEKSAEAQADAVARGVCPFPSVPPGLALDDTNRVIPTDDLPVVAKAFEMRAEGAPIREVRDFLRSHGIERSYHGVQSLLGSALYVGEIHFGELVNRSAHDPLIDRSIWERVQAQRPQRGRRASSDRLLARLGVLRCGTCGARMTVGTQRQNGRIYPFYRCPPVGDCTRRVTISAEIAEREIVAAAKKLAREVQGRAAEADTARADAEVADKAQRDLDGAISAFGAAGLTTEPAAVARLEELAQIRDEAVARAEHSGHLHLALAVDVDDWDRLPLATRRGLIRSTIERATVGPGKGAGRISIHPFG